MAGTDDSGSQNQRDAQARGEAKVGWNHSRQVVSPAAAGQFRLFPANSSHLALRSCCGQFPLESAGNCGKENAMSGVQHS